MRGIRVCPCHILKWLYSLRTIDLGIFSRFFPLAGKHNTRIILVNRRDYPDSVPFTEEELGDISPLKLEASGEGASLILQNYARERAKELYDFLEVVVVKEKIPKNKGLTIAGWSFGTVWITAFLAYASSFPVGKVRLAPYIRRLVAYGIFSHLIFIMIINSP